MTREKPQTLPIRPVLGAQLDAVRYREYADEAWRRSELERCSYQASVSVDALLGYGKGRQAARKLMKIGEQLRKLTNSGSAVDKQKARKLVAQMQPEFWLAERTSQTLRALLDRNPGEESVQLAQRLRAEPLAEGLAKVLRELERDDPDPRTLALEAVQLKKLAKQWSKAVEEAGDTLCLLPSSLLLSGLSD